MKKILLSMFAVSVIAVSAMAQTTEKSTTTEHKQKHEKGDRAGKHDAMQGHLKELNLSDAQKQQMKSLNEGYRKQMQDLKKNSSLSETDRKTQHEALAKQHRASIDGILTAEQKAKAKNFKKDGFDKKDGKEFTKGGRHEGGFDKAAKDLNLSADQSARFKSLNESFKSKAQAVRQNESLSKEQKKEQFQALQKQHKEELQSVLTKEQQEKFKQSRKGREGREAKI